MPHPTVPAAVLARYETFTINSTAPIWLHEAPLRDGSGDPVVPPYVVLHDDGTDRAETFEYYHWEVSRLRFEVYAASQAQADAIAAAVATNGGTVAAGSGMDYAAGLDLAAGMTFKGLRPDREPRRFQEGDRGGGADLVFRISLSYVAEVLRAA